MDIFTNRLHRRCRFVACFPLALAAAVHAGEPARENGNVSDSSTIASDEHSLQQNTSSKKRWYIDLDVATREARATGMPMMIVFR